MYSFTTRVTTSCTDQTKTQTLLSTVTMMQDCSMLWMEDKPVFIEWLDREKAAMMVASREVEIRRRADYGETLTVATWLYKFHGALGYRNTCIFDADDEAVAACWATGVFVRYADAKMLKIPQDVLDSLVLEPMFPMEQGKRKIVLPKVEPQALPPLKAQRSDIDFNKHVNNAQYVRMAYEFLPDGCDPRHLRIVHEGQARLGDAITPTLYRTDDAWTFTLTGNEGQRFATLEFKE